MRILETEETDTFLLQKQPAAGAEIRQAPGGPVRALPPGNAGAGEERRGARGADYGAATGSDYEGQVSISHLPRSASLIAHTRLTLSAFIVSANPSKMCLQTQVSEEHVQEALRLFEVSTIDAARSGAAEMVVLTPEQREELTLVETQIKQKLAIGATASKRHLVEDLARVGVNEWAVMRALMIMSQRGEITERAEGRRVTRVH